MKYDGSIPARINKTILIDTTSCPKGENFKGSGRNWLEYLWYNETKDDPNGVSDGGIEVKAYRCYLNDGSWDIHYNEPVDVGTQLHQGDYIYVNLTIHIPQDNDYQKLRGGFSTEILVVQWNEYPYTPPTP